MIPVLDLPQSNQAMCRQVKCLSQLDGVRRYGFTLTELIVAIGIIAALIAMLLPVVEQVRESSRRIVCLNNIRQLSLASLNYETAHGELPPGLLASPIPGKTKGFNPQIPGISKPNFIGTKVFLLPFLELDNLNQQFSTNRSVETGDKNSWWKFPEPAGGNIIESASTEISSFLCPSDRGHKRAESIFLYVHARDNRVTRGRTVGKEYLSRTNYMSCAGALGGVEIGDRDDYWHSFTGIYFNRSTVPIGHISDGTSNVIAFGETASNTVSSDGRPADYSWVCDGMPTAWGIHGSADGGSYFQYKSKHRGNLVSFAMADGSCRSVTPSIELLALLRLSGKSDGAEVVTE